MSVKVTDNTPAVKIALQQKASIFLRLMAEKMIDISTPKTPKRTGRLRMDVLKQVLGLKGKVVWAKGYAAILEEKQFKNYTTADTNKDFAKNAAKKLPGLTSEVGKKSGLVG